MPSRTSRSPSPAVRGRPRSPRAHNAVLAATRTLIEEGGYAAATIEEIAARSGVAKTTIYRRWPNRPSLVVELLMGLAAEVAPPPAGRDPLRALRTEMLRVAVASDGLAGQLLIALLSEAQRDPEVRDALVHGLFDPRRRASAQVVQAAQEAGMLRKGVPPLVVVDMLFGPLFYRRFIRQERATEAFVRQVFDHAMAGLATRSRPQ